MNSRRIIQGRHSSRRVTSSARGVVLLVMLSLLGLFTAIAMTFVIASGQFRRGANAAARVEQMGDPFEGLLNQALMQIVRGSNHPQSVVGPHSLLEDLYGNSDAVCGFLMIDTLPFNVSTELAGWNPSSWPVNSTTGVAANPESMVLKVAAASFGWDRKPGVAGIDDDNNGLIDDLNDFFAQPPQNGAPFTGTGDDGYLGQMQVHPTLVGQTMGAYQGNKTDLKQFPFVDNIDNYYAGRVLTFTTGDCAGQSVYVVRSKIVYANQTNPGAGWYTILWLTAPENRKRPSTKDQYVINGRPFSGTGFGYTSFTYGANGAPMGSKYDTSNPSQTVPGHMMRMLEMPYDASPSVGASTKGTESQNSQYAISGKVPIALTPNPTDAGYRKYLTELWPLVDADEDYDAGDSQNMLLSYTQSVPATDASGNPVLDQYGNRVFKSRTVPSLHRPDLVRFFRETVYPNLNTSAAGYNLWWELPPSIRRRIILRPDPADHHDTSMMATPTAPWSVGDLLTYDANGDGHYDPATDTYQDLNSNNSFDPTDPPFANAGFDAIDGGFPGRGTWDVDNDGDGEPDSIWVDLGMPAVTLSDGRRVKPLFAVRVIDLDGRANVNAHGSPKHYDADVTESGLAMSSGSDNFLTPGSNNPNFPNMNHATGSFANTTGTAPPMPQNNSAIHPTPTTEERIIIGGLAYATHVNLPGGGGQVVFDPVITGEQYPTFKAAIAPLRKLPIPAWATVFDQEDMSQGADYTLQGNPSTWANFYQRNAAIPVLEPAFGQGASVADVNIGAVLSALGHNPQLGTGTVGNTPVYTSMRYNTYRELFEGPESPAVPGRYGERHLRPAQNPGVPLFNPTTKKVVTTTMPGFFPGQGVRPRAGITKGDAAGQLNANSMAIPPSAPQFGTITSTNGQFTNSNDGVYDDNVPGVMSFTANLAYGAGWGNSREVYAPYFIPKQNQFTTPQGDYGTPGDPDSNGYVGLDLNGNPIYQAMGTLDESVDDPAEINLNRRYSVKMVLSGNMYGTPSYGSTNNVAEKDAPFTPSELERLLRIRDKGSAALSDRLASYFPNAYDAAGDVLTTESWDIPCPHVAPTAEMADALRALRLPTTNVTIGDLLRARFYLASGRTIDLNHATVMANYSMRSYLWRAFSGSNPPNIEDDWNLKLNRKRTLSADLAIGLKMDVNAPFGNGFDDSAPNTPGYGTVDEPGEESLANYGAPNSLNYVSNTSFLNFDGNRDGNVNPIAPEDARQQFAKELYCLMMLLLDQNYVYVHPQPAQGGQPPENVNAPIQGLNHPTKGANQFTVGDWLTAQRIAQWAVNAVDFRDRDSIMTGFEFDVQPFYDNDGDTQPGGSLNMDDGTGLVKVGGRNTKTPVNCGWDVDGILQPRVNTNKNQSQGTLDDTGQLWRGVVWGCEYPDILLTETFAFHDRRVQNRPDDNGATDNLMRPITGSWRLTQVTTVTGSITGTTVNYIGNGTILTYTGTGTTTTTLDTEWDQVRVPQGSAFIELYATGNPNLGINQAPELYNLNPTTGTALLDLSRTAPTDTYSVILSAGSATPVTINAAPVWRLVITQGRLQSTTTSVKNLPQNDVAERLAANPATCSLDPGDANFSVLSQTIMNAAGLTGPGPIIAERVVHFAPPGVTATYGLNLASASLTDQINLTPPQSPAIDVFTSLGNSVTAAPGDYVVVGPARPNANNVTTIGRGIGGLDLFTDVTGTMTFTNGKPRTTNTTDAFYPDVREAAITVNGFFAATNPGGAYEYPTYLVQKVNGGYTYTPQSDYSSPGVTLLGNFVNSQFNDAQADQCGYNQIRRPIAVPCACATDTSSGIPLTIANITATNSVGLNISEPNVANGDRARIYAVSSGTCNFVAGGAVPNVKISPWDNQVDPQDYIVIPKQGGGGGGASPSGLQQDVVVDDLPWDGYYDDQHANIPLVLNPQLDGIRDHTVLLYKSVFLQRLADPTKAWNRFSNPYITMDWMPFDLTVFNGEPWAEHIVRNTDPNVQADKIEHFIEPGNFNPPNPNSATPDPFSNVPERDIAIRFGTRQRGAPRFPFRGNYSYLNLWSQPDWRTPDPNIPGRPLLEMDTRPPLTADVSRNQDAIRVPNNPTSGQAVTAAYRYGLGKYKYYGNGNEFKLRWQHPPQHTLGYINESYHYRLHLQTFYHTGGGGGLLGYDYRDSARANANAPDVTRRVSIPVRKPAPKRAHNPDVDCGWITAFDFSQNGSILYDTQYVGSPWRPFNWLTWNNRPYMGAMELMQVPSCSPSRLLFEFDMRRATDEAPVTAQVAPNLPRLLPPETTVSGNQYFIQTQNTGRQYGYQHRWPYGHLLNFFESSKAMPGYYDYNSNQINPDPANATPANFYRIFEYVTVPSRFSGTRQSHHSHVYNNASAGPATGPATQHVGWPFVAPFNSISAYREPGRINLNSMVTLASRRSAIWMALTNDFFPHGWAGVQVNTSTNPAYSLGNNDPYDPANPPPPLKPKFSDATSLGTRKPWNPSQATSDNYDSLERSVITWSTNLRPTAFDNPFRSFSEAFGSVLTITTGAGLKQGNLVYDKLAKPLPGGSGLDQNAVLYKPQVPIGTSRVPNLAVDSTLLRRQNIRFTDDYVLNSNRDTNPYSFGATPSPDTEINPLYDPLFTLNFPGPFANASTHNQAIGGYGNYMFYRWGVVPRNAGYQPPIVVPNSENQMGAVTNMVSRANDYRNTDRNPFFRYQLYTKLSNLATTRSNVYAIWVTVGYFEVERVDTGPTSQPATQQGFSPTDDLDTLHRFPDGYRIVREAGSDTGQIVRHKAFAMFDRTIPVGFMRGENYNVDKAFLIRRIVY